MGHDDPAAHDDNRSVGDRLCAPARGLHWHAHGSWERCEAPLGAHCRGDRSGTASPSTSYSPSGPPCLPLLSTV